MDSCLASIRCSSSLRASPWHSSDSSEIEFTRCTTLCLYVRHCSTKSTITSCRSPSLLVSTVCLLHCYAIEFILAWLYESGLMAYWWLDQMAWNQGVDEGMKKS